jgi:uncharacterized protein DUF6166
MPGLRRGHARPHAPTRYLIRRETATRRELLALGWSEHDLRTLAWPRVVHAYAIDDAGTEPRPVTHHVRHSPSGFEFGYEGSGPAELARCLLIHYFDAHEHADDRDRDPLPVSYQQFKREFIARVPQTVREFEIDADAIDARVRREPTRP